MVWICRRWRSSRLPPRQGGSLVALANDILVSFVVDPGCGEVIVFERFIQSTVEVFLSFLHRSIPPTSHSCCFSTDV